LQHAPTTDVARTSSGPVPSAQAAPVTEAAAKIDAVDTARQTLPPKATVASTDRSERDPGASPPARRAPKSRPDLAAEVAALDVIRTAVAIGAWQEAEAELARYRRTFAKGALHGEAEVLAITSLLGQGRKQAAANAAQLFIAQHPRDPQVARVRALVE